jgi:hypothetical protein
MSGNGLVKLSNQRISYPEILGHRRRIPSPDPNRRDARRALHDCVPRFGLVAQLVRAHA